MDQPLTDVEASPAEPPNPARQDRLCSDLYEDLRRQAHNHLRRGGRHHTLETTELIHEAYLRLRQGHRFGKVAQDRFLAAAAWVMRDVLADRARRRGARKRGGGQHRVPLDDAPLAYYDSTLDMIALDDALTRLSELDPRMTRIIELRFLGGLTERQTADALGISDRTVRREWRIARLWLSRELGDREPDDA